MKLNFNEAINIISQKLIEFLLILESLLGKILSFHFQDIRVEDVFELRCLEFRTTQLDSRK